MIENPPDDARMADEAWFEYDDGAIKQLRFNRMWAWEKLGLNDTAYIARFGRRWFLFRGRAGVREVVEFQTKEAAQMAWRIMS